MNQTDADIKLGADAMPARDPQSVVLSVICGKDQVLLTLNNGESAKYANVPMKPGSYKILQIADAGPSDMTGIVLVTNPGKHTLYEIAGQGQFNLAQFDLKGIAGNFSLEAQRARAGSRFPANFTSSAKGREKLRVEGTEKVRALERMAVPHQNMAGRPASVLLAQVVVEAINFLLRALKLMEIDDTRSITGAKAPIGPKVHTSVAGAC
jgi:hypothetical protein